jgi:hypothetical protein
MAPYRVQTSDDIERQFELIGFDRNADIAPSVVGAPVPSGLSGEQWLAATRQFLDETELQTHR